MPADENLVAPVSGQKWKRGFWSLIATQFQSAFNENGLKNLVIFLILAMNLGKEDRDWLVLLVAGCLPGLSSYFRWPADIWRTGLANAA